MAELLSRLHALRPVVERIRTVSGAAGVSVGIVHEGEVLLTDSFGFRDVEGKLAPDQDTLYYLSSLSKSFTASAVAHLVIYSSDLSWDTPVAEAFPPISHETPEIRQNATIVDFLSHRTGLAPKNHIWSQEFGRFTLKRGEDIRTITHLEKVAEF
jgi:CubicO group peptidase (beta-lactamase class C family)